MTHCIKLCDSAELTEDESKGFQVGELKLLAVRHQGAVHVYLNRCPHLGIPLEWLPHQFLDSEKEFIQCSTHGALFLIETGECVSGPCAGDYLLALDVAEEEGSVNVTLPPH